MPGTAELNSGGRRACRPLPRAPGVLDEHKGNYEAPGGCAWIASVFHIPPGLCLYQEPPGCGSAETREAPGVPLSLGRGFSSAPAWCLAVFHVQI